MSVEFFLNHVWQSTAFAAVMVALAWALRRQQARVKFAVWLAASVKFLLPFGVLVEAGRRLPWPQSWTLSWALSWTSAAGVAHSGTVAALQPVVRTVSAPFATQAVTLWDGNAGAGGHPLLIAWLIGVWAAGAVLLGARWFGRWWRLARIARQGEPRQIEGLRVVVCDQALEPGVFGIVRPLVLLPRGVEQQLCPDELEAVLAHERAHVRRRDNLWSAVHGVVECLFWFHPGVWWLGRKLVEERERACDEAVLEAGADREAYASSILRVCRFYVEVPETCAAGVSGGGGLRQRIAGILHGTWGARLGAPQKAMLWGLGAAAFALPLAAGLLLAQSAGPAAFEAASVRIAKVPSEGIPIRFRTDPRRLTVENMPLDAVLAHAYGLEPYQIRVPHWMHGERLDIEAETATPASSAQMKMLLQPFLIKQFGMKLHWTTTTADLYRLTVAPGGLKIKPSPADTSKPIWLTIGDGTMRITGSATMAGFAELLSQQAGRPVVDATGLSGNYDIDCRFRGSIEALAGQMLPPGVGNFMITVEGRGRPGRGPTPPPDAAGQTLQPAPALSAALPQQLGLRLVSAKGPIKVLVIDSANPTPVGN